MGLWRDQLAATTRRDHHVERRRHWRRLVLKLRRSSSFNDSAPVSTHDCHQVLDLVAVADPHMQAGVTGQ
jgi:hypothetical protein